MQKLWKVQTGACAGTRDGDNQFNGAGQKVGYFVGNVAYSLSGAYIGEVVAGDRLGKRKGQALPPPGPPIPLPKMATPPQSNCLGSGWSGTRTQTCSKTAVAAPRVRG